jgi:hypothetical protein
MPADSPADPLDTPSKPRFPWLALSLVLVVLLLVVGMGIYVVRSSPSAAPASQAGKTPATPASTPPADRPSAQTMSAFGPVGPRVAPPVTSAAPVVGNSAQKNPGVPQNSCQGFAEIAVRFWDLKKEGRPLQFVLSAIEQNSGGDVSKIRVLKALAQVVYQDPNVTRDQAYGNAIEACVKAPS